MSEGSQRGLDLRTIEWGSLKRLSLYGPAPVRRLFDDGLSVGSVSRAVHVRVSKALP